MEGIFKGWSVDERYGFIKVNGMERDVFLHINNMTEAKSIPVQGDALSFDVENGYKGLIAKNVNIINSKKNFCLVDSEILSDEIEDLDASNVSYDLLQEISNWKREAKLEDNDRYFWHVKEVDQISHGRKFFIIGRKGSGKTAICEYFYKIKQYNVFSEKLSFKQFPFNELYSHKNQLYTKPNQYITIWKYLIYNTICQLMFKDESINTDIRDKLKNIFDDTLPFSRKVRKWVGKEFGFSLYGVSFKISETGNSAKKEDISDNWIDYVDYVEDILRDYKGGGTYYILFDELDEDYRDIINADQYHQYTELITSLFKVVQDIRSIFGDSEHSKFYPVIFLRDDIYEITQDSDKNKWSDFKVDLNWDIEKIKSLIAFRITRALPASEHGYRPTLGFDNAWELVFGTKKIGMGCQAKRKINTFDYIARSTLLRPRDFVVYLKDCAEHVNSNTRSVSPLIIKKVDKAFSNYLRQELTDELFAVLPDIAKIFDAISQLRKWNFSIQELESAYQQQIIQGFIKEKKFGFSGVIQILFIFDVIGNLTKTNRPIFRYQNREARLNFNERLVVHRGLFKALQIL